MRTKERKGNDGKGQGIIGLSIGSILYLW